MKYRRLASFLKEPIVQFTILGALLFGMDHYLLLDREDPRNVLIDDNQIREFIDIFEDGQGRPPSGREINNMLIAWAQNEILYREARRMGLDRGDEMIRNRLILKLHNVIFSNVVIENPGEEQLEQFFEINKAAYYIPERYDIEMIALPGDHSLSDARRLQHLASHEYPGDGIRYRYDNRSADNLAALFGAGESAALLSADQQNGSWSLISNERGHHLVRVTAKRDPVAPAMDNIRSRLIQDWERFAADQQIAEQTHGIARQYQVHLDISDTYLDMMDSDLPRNPFTDSLVEEP